MVETLFRNPLKKLLTVLYIKQEISLNFKKKQSLQNINVLEMNVYNCKRTDE